MLALLALFLLARCGVATAVSSLLDSEASLDALLASDSLDPIKVCGLCLKFSYQPPVVPAKTADGTNPLDIVLVLDKSSSIEPIYRDVLGSTNAFIREQQKLIIDDAPLSRRFSLQQFSNDFTWVREVVPLESVSLLTRRNFKIGGGTALYDAIGNAIHRFRHQRDVILAIVTDGEENQSHRFSLSDIRNLLDCYQQRVGWQVVYLSASELGHQAGAQMGVPSASNIHSTYDTLASSMSMVSAIDGNYTMRIQRLASKRSKVAFDDEDDEEREL